MTQELSSIKLLPRQTFSAGDILLEEGTTSGKLFFLAEGTLEVVKDGVRIAELRDQGAPMGEMSVLLKEPHTTTVKAKVDSEVFVVNDPQSFLQEHPEVALYLSTVLARRLDALNRYLVEVKHQFADNSDHLGMVDGVLESLMNRYPRVVERRHAEEQ